MKRTAIILIAFFASHANASLYWPPETLTNWSLYLNNGRAYIESPDFASHCEYSRGQIILNGTEFDQAQYAYAMSAKARGKNLRYVVDSEHTTYTIYGLVEVD